jgi:hypothetical protein
VALGSQVDECPWVPVAFAHRTSVSRRTPTRFSAGFLRWRVDVGMTHHNTNVSLSRSYRQFVRVWELARELGVSSAELVDLLRAEGEWVDSHLSRVPDPRIARIRTNPPSPTRTRDVHLPKPTPRRVEAPRTPPRKLRRKRFPGPKPLSLKPPQEHADDDFYYDRQRHRDYGPQVTTRDIARMFDVQQATVRMWVRRGHITPIDKLSNSNVFDTADVLSAHRGIEERSRMPGKGQASPKPSHWQPNRPHIAAKYFDVIVDISQAAGLVHVSPATVRTWIHRGHVKRVPSSRPRDVRLRIGDVLAAATRRRPPKKG